MIIKINQLKLKPIIGAFEWERQTPMTIYADIVIECDIPDAEDELTSTVDYYQLSKTLLHEAAKTDFKLLEKLAYFLQKTILNFDQRIKRLSLTLSKQGILQDAASTSVTLLWPTQ